MELSWKVFNEPSEVKPYFGNLGIEVIETSDIDASNWKERFEWIEKNLFKIKSNEDYELNVDIIPEGTHIVISDTNNWISNYVIDIFAKILSENTFGVEKIYILNEVNWKMHLEGEKDERFDEMNSEEQSKYEIMLYRPTIIIFNKEKELFLNAIENTFVPFTYEELKEVFETLTEMGKL